VNNQRGFSYIEILIALAVFAIALVAILPVLSQASRNLSYAQNTYIAHLRAQSLMLTIRDTLAANADPEPVTRDFPFTVWLIGGTAGDRSFSTPGAPPAHVDVSGFAYFGNRTLILVTVWNEHGNKAGQAMGFV